MGGFYGSIQVRTDDRDAVLRAVEAVATGSQRRFLCGPVIKGWIGVYPDNAGQSAADGDAIAARVASDAFYLCVHDDDVFCYRFYQAGRLVDEYVSMPGYFGEARREEELGLVGHPERYASLLDGRGDAVRKLLRRHEDREQPAFESERLAAFAKLLGIANVVTSYEYLTDGEREGIRGWRAFVHVPALDDEKRAARARAAVLRAEKAKLVKQGVLLADRTHALFETIRSDRSLDHVFIEVGGRELHSWGPDWKEPPRVYCLPPKDRIFSAMSGDGRYAVTQRQGLHPFMPNTPIRIESTPELWTLPGCDLIGDGAPGIPIFAADSSRVLFVPREGGEIVAYKLPGGELQGRWPSPFSATVGHKRLLHPAQDVVVAADQRRIIVHDLERGATKHISVGESGDNKDPYRWIELAKQIQHLGIAALPKLLEDVPERRRADAEKELRRLWPAASLSEHAMSIVQHAMRFSLGLESIVHLRLSCDGSFVYCGTSNGLRVYAWADLLAGADGAAIEPRLYFNPPADVLETNPMHGYVHATVDDNANNRVLFSGNDGRIRAARRDTGEVSLLFELPERAVIYEMHLVGESSLVCRVAPGIKDRKKRRDSDLKGRLQVWNLRAIDEMNAKGAATPARTAARDRRSSTS